MKAALATLAGQGVFVGTSSWKYAGWCGLLYDRERYQARRKFAEARFNRNCLAEYAEVFKTVCVDAAYYKFPERHCLEELCSQTPPDFKFAFKVTDDITLKNFPNLPRFGVRAGTANANFLNADLFISNFLGPCELFRDKLGVLIFEFSKFYPSDYRLGRAFASDLDLFLSKLPKDWPYAVEIRNKHFLHPSYFEVLNRHGVAHTFNSWGEMPAVIEQLGCAGSRTCSNLCAARFLLKPGRKYQEAVDLFQPYHTLKEPNAEARAAAAALIQEGLASGGERKTFIYVNNRLEGNALETIAAILEM